MIFYTDMKCYQKIKEIRESFGFLNKTQFIIKELKDLSLYKFKQKITDNRKNDPLFVDSRNTPDYFILVSSKFELLKISTDINPLPSEEVGGGYL